jgi:hypothetical protein
MRAIFALTLLILTTPGLATAQGFSSLEERMSAAEFRAAGLDKLSPEELARLNAWLAAQFGAQALAGSTLPEPVQDRRGLPQPQGPRETIVSRIDGDFDGWNGGGPRKTRFVLQNGQVWEQIDTSVFLLRATDPVVTIEPAMFGSWILKVEGYNQGVRVRRIR